MPFGAVEKRKKRKEKWIMSTHNFPFSFLSVSTWEDEIFMRTSECVQRCPRESEHSKILQDCAHTFAKLRRGIK